MAVTATSNARDLCTAAMEVTGRFDISQSPESSEMDVAVRALNRMLKGWQARPDFIWKRTGVSVTVTDATASYSLAARYADVMSARFKRSGVETPMLRLTRGEYDDLPQKTVSGTPTNFYYDRQREAGTLYVWPVLAAASGETIELTVAGEIEDITDANDAVDVPAEWYDAVVYGLASRLSDVFSVKGERLVSINARAVASFELANASDRDASVYFMADTW